MLHQLYTPNPTHRGWQVAPVDDARLMGRARRGLISEQSLLYNPETAVFTSALEYALFLGRANSPQLPNRGNHPAPLVPHWSETQAQQSHRAPEIAFQPFTGPTKLCEHSRTDEMIARYIPKFQNSTRLLLAGVLTLPMFGAGLLLILVGWRQRSVILRLVAQTGMTEKVWMDYVGQCVPRFRLEQKALLASAAAIGVAAIAVIGNGLMHRDMRVATADLFSDTAPIAHASSKTSRFSVQSQNARLESARGLTQ